MIDQLNHITEALQAIRLHPKEYERDIHEEIAPALADAGLTFDREVSIAPRCRIDFLVEPGIGIEVKKGKPTSKAVEGQIKRYLSTDNVHALILVVERNVFSHITEHEGKPVRYISLSKLWGIAL